VVVELAGHGRITRVHGCVRFTSEGKGGTLDLLLPPTGLYLKALVGAKNAPPAAIRARRFASGYENDPATTLAPGGAITLTPVADSAHRPWHVRISPYGAVEACLF
jgi:hypothetical protein